MKKVYDPVRKIEILAKPEELVRQAILQWLNWDLKIPFEWMQVEYSIPQSSFFGDIAVHFKNSKGFIEPLLLVELKAPKVAIGQDAFDQVLRYLRKESFSYVLISNGVDFHYLKNEKGQITAINQLPNWDQMRGL